MEPSPLQITDAIWPVHIEHLSYTVFFEGKSESDEDIGNCERLDANSCKITMHMPIEEHDLSTLVHEIIHALQFICDDRGIEFTDEMEHMAYVADYIFRCAYPQGSLDIDYPQPPLA